jgi:hypothetical protein
MCLPAGTIGVGIADSVFSRAGWSRVRFPLGARDISLHHNVQTGSKVQPAFYAIRIEHSFPGGKAVGA